MVSIVARSFSWTSLTLLFLCYDFIIFSTDFTLRWHRLHTPNEPIYRLLIWIFIVRHVRIEPKYFFLRKDIFGKNFGIDLNNIYRERKLVEMINESGNYHKKIIDKNHLNQRMTRNDILFKWFVFSSHFKQKEFVAIKVHNRRIYTLFLRNKKQN